VNRLKLAAFSILLAGGSGCWLAVAAQQSSAQPADQHALQEAASWIEQATRPAAGSDTEYDYEMTCKVRLLLFWAGRDDVGEGYIRVSKASGSPEEQMIQVLFGSDPAKAPRAINRWGAGTEVLRGEGPGDPKASSAFFGFMKSSQGQSVGAMQEELSRENSGGQHAFEGIISRIDDNRAIAATVPFMSAKDFTLHQYSEAEIAALNQLEAGQNRKIKHLEGASQVGCNRAGGFLSTIEQLIDEAVDGKPTPASLCYVYDARRYTATLLSVHPVSEKTIHYALRDGGRDVDYAQRNLQEARFLVTNHESGGKSAFQVLLGTEGSLRGVPIQINYEPNWWFQIILNLTPSSLQALDRGAASPVASSLY
jgi:hypothetical protein